MFSFALASRSVLIVSNLKSDPHYSIARELGMQEVLKENIDITVKLARCINFKPRESRTMTGGNRAVHTLAPGGIRRSLMITRNHRDYDRDNEESSRGGLGL
ncbi:jg5442 [Pararge aegeria aegeria]|uniref:Jg5442 protein n=1 Tax=Pararge aegeria aegeria TaxID=348720 RepID=A0A8S4S9P2_9NEOP|nr:jg5442 [Pararge aegeria aegeria]